MEGSDGDEMEMTPKELQRWIRDKVKESKLVDPQVLRTCHQLESVLQRREKQAAAFLQLCESVAECEAVIKKLHCQLGWEYRDSDSGDEKIDSMKSAINADYEDVQDCDDLPPSTHEAVPGESANASNPAPPSLQRQNGKTQEAKGGSSSLKKTAVVVLAKLPAYKIRAACRRRSNLNYSSEEDLSNCGSDTQWEPNRDCIDSSDSDWSSHSLVLKSNKKRERHRKTGKFSKNKKAKASPQANANANVNVKINTTAPQGTTKTSDTEKVTPSQINTSVTEEAATKQTKTTATLNAELDGLVVSSVSQAQPSHTTKPASDLPELEIKVNMKVLAMRKTCGWKRGKIVAIVTKADGKVKYKVDFEEKARVLVSGHHIAFDMVPAMKRLYIGARVVATHNPNNQQLFSSGILGEMPTRMNRMRLLVFLDNHKPLYVGLPYLYLVCRPLKDVCEDIPDISHRNFIRQYLHVWPFPPLTLYKVGQTINVEHEGTLKKCEVKVIDSSLIQVVFQDDQHEEWIYRGSTRLEHIANIKKDAEKEVSVSEPKAKDK
ncbi:histone-lysine N-methyltransferase SETDB1-A-like isoform X2 [Myripristis murdjan]|uniref:histone-lysine N-methyltransferase SETDB1-A-like isoform X2 n=1 Tax=Myripristis murdjan TaxID=586833 RepID=UPI00117613AB|nr:histone-lysine N-methyltransferase SETDB1-A-like isoform X2 [Myripristis murdjan]